MSSITSVTPGTASSSICVVGDPHGSLSATPPPTPSGFTECSEGDGFVQKQVIGHITSLKHILVAAGHEVTPMNEHHFIIAIPEFPDYVDHSPGSIERCLFRKIIRNVLDQRVKYYEDKPELLMRKSNQSKSTRIATSLWPWMRQSNGLLYPEGGMPHEENPRLVFFSFPPSYLKILEKALENIADPTKLDNPDYVMNGVIEDIRPTLKAMPQFKCWDIQTTHDGTTRDVTSIIAGYASMYIFVEFPYVWNNR